MSRSTLVLAALLAGCTFPDVLTDGLDGVTGAGPSSGASPSTTDASSSGGPSAGGGPATTGVTSSDASSSSAQGGAGGTGGDGGAGTAGAPGTGGGGGAPGVGGGGGDGGGASTASTTSSVSTATTTTGSGGSGPCPEGCEACGGACPLDAASGDCDADGDPDATDCQMCDDRAFTGQPAFFVDAYPRLGGGTSFDYDCSGSATTDFNEGVCSGLVCPNVARFYSEPPTCGDTATSVSCKAVAIVGCTTDETFNDRVGCH